jgi:hypothetical protein
MVGTKPLPRGLLGNMLLEMKESAEWIGASTGFIVEKCSCGGRGGGGVVTSKKAGAASRLQIGGIYEVGGKALGRSLGGIILNGPLTLMT